MNTISPLSWQVAGTEILLFGENGTDEESGDGLGDSEIIGMP